jgi:adenine-specific DNA-methyltransferase
MATIRTRSRRPEPQTPTAVDKTHSKYDSLNREELIKLLLGRDAEEEGGIRLTYTGQAPPWQIVRRVQPRRQKIEKLLCVGSEEDQSSNLIVEGENLQAMVSLYKYRGQVDLILTDPPYNTGGDFRYNDRWDEDPNDPDLGKIVPAEDNSRHSKWLRFMTPRLWMMKEMLKPTGVLAICIDHRELFRLGILLDQIFDECNRIAVINWQKTTVKNDKKHVASTTEYILVYCKREEQATTRLLERSEKANARFGNPDNDPLCEWKQGDPSATGDHTHRSMVYAIQSPFDGLLHYPPEGRHWANEKRRMKEWLTAWGSQYIEKDIDDQKAKALVIKDAPLPTESKIFKRDHPVLERARERAEAKLKGGAWPALYFGHTGLTKPMMKVYLNQVKAGSVPTTFWVDENEPPLELDATSWTSAESGRSREGIEELDSVVGQGHGFRTVKPLKLFKKIIQLWCPPTGIVFDAFAGSGTTAHAVLELNDQTGSDRRFILIEQGRPERGDSYARTLTFERVRRAITGERADKGGAVTVTVKPLGGGFRFTQLTKKVDGDAVLALEREEMLDLLLTSHWDQSERSGCHLQRLPAGAYNYLFAINGRGEGYFLVWNGPQNAAFLDRAAFKGIAEEAKAAGLKVPYHVYARVCAYFGPNIEFYQIPNRILEKLGFNEATEPYSSGSSEEE